MNQERLRQLRRHYEELQKRLEEPSTWQNPELFARLQKEAQELSPLAEAYGAWEKVEEELQAAEEMLGDPELRELAAGTDLCVHCATVEVEGLSIMEAIQQGAVPVIAEGWHTGASQFALDSRSIFPEKDDKALAERIDWWLSHPSERWEAGKQYAASMKGYDIALSAQKLISMFKEALQAK